MFLKRFSFKLPQTLYLKLVLIFFIIMLIVSGILFGGTFFTLYNSLKNEDESYMRQRLLSYWGRYQASGIDGLIEALHAETLIHDERPFFVRVADMDNQTVFLSYPEHWESFAIQKTLETLSLEAFNALVILEDGNPDFELEVDTIFLDDEYLIQVGMSSERRGAFLRLYRRNFLVFLVFVLAFGLTAGLVLAGRAVAPIRRFSSGLRSITQTGDLSARLPVRQEGGKSDEIDELGALFNQLLDRIENLIGRMRGTLDAVAHELRTPLTRLRSGAEFALQSSDGRQKDEALSDALEESERILILLTTLMDISEAESGILKLDRKPINPSSAVEKVAEVYQFVASDRGIDIRISGTFPETVQIDPARFSQAVGNLLDNAVKYSPDNGVIRLTGSVDSSAEPPSFSIAIENQGPHIPEEELPRIWERLYRVSGNTAPGLGLGLSMVKAVAFSHGGKISAVNIHEGGVRFTLEFPLS